MSRAAILQAIQALPLEEQEALLHDLLALLPVAEKPLIAPNSSRLAGLFDNGSPAPADAEVTAWLEEHRQEKYGQS
jgi:hypothetical protein